MNLINKILSKLSKIFFEDITPKFKTELLKGFMNKNYIIFEKISHNFNIISTYYETIYEDIINNEIKLANIKKNDLILVIGCGSLPITPMLIAKKTSAKIVAIDKDKKSVKDAEEFILNKNLKNLIEIKHANGFKFKVSSFDKIFISYGINNYMNILKKYFNSMKSDTKIIIRIPSEEDFEKRFIDDISDYFIKIDKTVTKTMGSTISLLLKKK